ncbi:MAG: D-alanine--D-alanine ligase [Ginsengibacter sp.]
MKSTIALVTGGFSGESVISYQSAAVIEKHIDQSKFEIYKIEINPKGWFHEPSSGKKIEVNKNDFSLLIDDETIHFDAALIAIHGTPGEDGKLQGYFDMLRIPYTSCDCATSAITFNKKYTVAVAAGGGLSVAKSILLFQHSYRGIDEILQNLKFPIFVKPNNGGSSIGMSKVNSSSDDLEAAIEKAFKEDQQVIVEEFIKGRELTIGVFKSKGEIIPLPITEIISKKDFFDYEAKYLGASEEITPAEFSEDVTSRIREAATNAYRIFNCKGIVRIDFIYNEADARPYMLEINTVPGQSEASIVPQQVRAMGWTMTDFYTRVIEECLHT